VPSKYFHYSQWQCDNCWHFINQTTRKAQHCYCCSCCHSYYSGYFWLQFNWPTFLSCQKRTYGRKNAIRLTNQSSKTSQQLIVSDNTTIQWIQYTDYLSHKYLTEWTHSPLARYDPSLPKYLGPRHEQCSQSRHLLQTDSYNAHTHTHTEVWFTSCKDIDEILYSNIKTSSVTHSPFHPVAQNFVTKTLRVLVAAHTENFRILACTVLIGLKSVTERQTPRERLRRVKHYVLLQVKITNIKRDSDDANLNINCDVNLTYTINQSFWHLPLKKAA